jgi:hypothetical protein
MITKGNVHDSRVSYDKLDSVRDFSHILGDFAYHISDITHYIPVIDMNRIEGMVPERFSVNQKIGIYLGRGYASLYLPMCEIERTFSILEEILKKVNIRYTKNRSYDAAIGMKAIAYHLTIVSNIRTGISERR